MDIEIEGKTFKLELEDRDPFYLDEIYLKKNLTEIYNNLDPEMRDLPYLPFPFFHPKKKDEKNTLFKSMNGVLHQLTMIWDQLKFEQEFDNILTLIYINNKDNTYNRRTLWVSMKEKPKSYESKR